MLYTSVSFILSVLIYDVKMESKKDGTGKGRLLLSWEAAEQVAEGEGERLHSEEQGAETRFCLSSDQKRHLRPRDKGAEVEALPESIENDCLWDALDRLMCSVYF